MVTDKKKIKRDYSDKLLSAGTIFLAGSFIISFINYLYHVFMGRMLGASEYGVLGSLFAIIYITTFTTGSFNLAISKFTAELNGKNQQSHINYLLSRAIRYVFIYGTILLLIFFILTPYIASFLNLNSISGLFIVGIISLASFIFTIMIGALNGFQKFVWQNISSVTSASIKFLLAIILVFLGFGVNGALIAIFFGIVLGIFIASYPITKTLKNTRSEEFDTKRIQKHFPLIILGFMIPIFIITLDQILVKHFFSSKGAGLYTAAGMIAKIIWFGSSFLISPLFPKIIESKIKNKPTSSLLNKALICAGIIAFLGVLGYFFIPGFIINILYGPSYIEIVKFIGLFGIALGLFSVNQIFVVYNIATENYKFIYIVALALFIEIIGIFIFHDTLLDIIKIVFTINLFITISFFIINKKDLGINGINNKH